jgi:peptidoglycan/xylan/chitin deacetylase (PgdA/CDA1 family)
MFDLTLTFDNGPESGVTDSVLDTLARREVRATFFVLGHKLAMPERRKLAERAHAEGHWIGNHTWSHETPLGMLDDARRTEAEISRTQAEIGALADPRRYFRPFGGGGNLDERLLNRAALDLLVRERFTCVLWNSIPRDWDDPEGWVDRALTQVAAQPWTLMVLHDLPTGAMTHLDRFIGEVRDRGARFRQDFPPECVPLVEGRVVGPVDSYVSAGD